ncbi:M48 family metallopeptidase [Chitinibacter sp. ZOR0017]|uniref:M48 family metallopeptidase n=1 Tax=Chitinibacter sp. ZOR0017 TaxID=1339254 RepID=UPI000645E2C8|nr:SprT family zinc-dependent metalloprotease [Chitinibacter sp. ZOR0017]
MQAIFRLPQGEIPYQVSRSARRRSIGLKIDAGGLTVILPARAPLAEAERVIQLKLTWIQTKLAQWTAQPPALGPAPWRWGDEVRWLGAPRRLLPASRTRLTEAELHLAAAREDLLTPALVRFYQRSARAYFAERVPFWAARMGLQPQRILLTSARTRWGSCTSQGAIRLNWRLLQAPAAVIDYVIIHELAHLREMNHSAQFWALVAQACPDWRQYRAWLKTHGQALMVLDQR